MLGGNGGLTEEMKTSKSTNMSTGSKLKGGEDNPQSQSRYLMFLLLIDIISFLNIIGTLKESLKRIKIDR
jgi:hypothetical protein